MIFLDPLGIGKSAASLLRNAGCPVFEVERGDAFSAREWLILLDPQVEEHFRNLEILIKAKGLRLRYVLNLWGMTGNSDDKDLPGRVAEYRKAFDGALHLCRNLLGIQEAAVDLVFAGDGLFDVSGEETLQPEKALLLGPALAVSVEYPNVRGRVLDFSGTRNPQAERIADQLLGEAILGSDNIVAFRGAARWVRRFQSAPDLESTPSLTPLRKSGVYLITGAFGGIGRILSLHLAGRYAAKLILVSRGVESGDQGLAQELRKEIIQLGGQVLSLRADVGDARDMLRVREEAQSRFGKIDGIFHAAGVAGGSSIQLRNAGEIEKVMAPKVTGSLVLYDMFSGFDWDFMVHFSSITAIVPHFGQCDYASANAFQDLFSAWACRQGKPMLSVNWAPWNEVGMAMNAALPARLKQHRQEMLRDGIDPAEGMADLERVLSLGACHSIVSPIPPDRWTETGLARHSQPMEPAKRHPRPDLAAAYAAPRTPLQDWLARVLAETLGYDKVGVEDNIFDLGVDSLMGIQISARIKEEFGGGLSPVILYACPTVNLLASALESRGGNDVAFSEAESRAEAQAAARRARSAAINGDVS